MENLSVRGQNIRVTGALPDADPAAPIALFLHGAGMDHTVWAPVTNAFTAAGRPWVAVDLPGHGGSAGDLIGTISEMADWLADVVGELGNTAVVAVGHSMGALVVLELAARHPRKTRAAALMGIAARMPVHPDLLAMAQANDPKAAALIAKWGVGQVAQGDVAPQVAACVTSAPAGALYADFAACDAYRDAEAMAAQVACPMLLVLGEEDRMTPPDKALPLVQAAQDARQTVMPETGHMMMLESPGPCAEALLTLQETVS